MSTSTWIALSSSSSSSRKTCFPRRWTMAPDRRSRIWGLVVSGAFAAWGFVVPASRSLADETYEQRVQRLEKMSPEEKADLQRKKDRFDKLPEAEKQRLRELHISITGDAKAAELAETIRRY